MTLNSRFFLTTRGKVLVILKKRGPCTVAYLSEQLKLTRNAIRQHLSALERDSLVTHQLLKTGPTKPSLTYSLAPQAESLFPKRYDRLLSNLLEELRCQQSYPEVGQVLARLGHFAAGGYLRRTTNLTGAAKVEEIRRILEEEGAIVEWEQRDGEAVIRDFNCPYAAVVKEHPLVCQVQRSFLARLLEPATVDIACDHEAARCQFQVRLFQ